MEKKIAVLGAGAWGVTLANMLAQKNDLHVALWSRNARTAEEINHKHQTVVLNDSPLCAGLAAFTDIRRVLQGAYAVVSVIVSVGLRDFLRENGRYFPGGVRIISATKGMEEISCLRMTQVLRDELPNLSDEKMAVLSGPNLASEIVQGKPASTVVASASQDTAGFFQALFHSDLFRVYTSDDVPGVELGGAMKNVIAIASGICVGMGLGDNTVAALATRGIKEISRLGVHMGAKAETFSGMAGLGDVIVTCVSRHSRNRSLGEEIGRGNPPAAVMAARKSVEGIHTVVALHRLARAQQIPLPICDMVYAVLFENFPVTETIGVLMGREPRRETQ